MKTKKVEDSSMVFVMQMTHQDANIMGNVHGGVIMKQVDNTTGIVATRHSQGAVVTASIDRLDFYSPVYVGDLLRIKACINLVGKTSMEIGAKVEAENFITGEVRHTASAYLTFVALDKDGKPKEVPDLLFENDDEKRRNKEAMIRKKMRLSPKSEQKKDY